LPGMGGKAAEDSIGFHVGEVDRGSGCVAGRYDERIGCDGKVTAMTSAYGEGGAGRRRCTLLPHRRGQPFETCDSAMTCIYAGPVERGLNPFTGGVRH